jgi:ectoine hydroxylase-related dioxygenase (phytanoyl-CoA dioxygenase family)
MVMTKEPTGVGVIRLTNRASPQDVADAIHRSGCVIVEELASADAIDAVEEELAPYISQAPFGSTDVTGKRTRRVGSIIARSFTARSLIANPLLLAAIERRFEPGTGFHVSLAETIYLWPGSKAQFLHQDEMVFGQFDFGETEVQVSTLWALSDYTEEMGATRVVPGSHRAGPGARFGLEDTVAAEMPRGSLMIYSGKVYHGSGENRSQAVRKALNVDYALGWLRQEENQYLSCSSEIAATLSEDLLRLMGYTVLHGCGWTGDRHDPLGAVLPTYNRAWEEQDAMG